MDRERQELVPTQCLLLSRGENSIPESGLPAPLSLAVSVERSLFRIHSRSLSSSHHKTPALSRRSPKKGGIAESRKGPLPEWSPLLILDA